MIINSVSGFISEIEKITKDDNVVVFFRGHGDKAYEMKPSIFRPIKTGSNDTFVGKKKEHLMFRDFVARYEAEFRDCFYTMDFLVKMQHYDLPTRTLDLTTNCLVALYFACSGSRNRRGEVIVFSIPEDAIRHYDSDKVSAIANLVKINSIDIVCPRPYQGKSTDKKFRDTEDYIKKFNTSGDMKRLLHEIQREKPYYQSIIDPNDLLDNIVTVMPKQNNQRVKNQSGAFLLFGLGKDGSSGNYTKEIHPKIPTKWILKGKDSITGERIFIPKSAKENILKELAQMGITESFIFPEMDKYAKELKEKYS
ncbi:FRG domain-containing protein [Porphyromonas sp. COT-108 OH1349]|uniref:FRG domain-containing protein n=1 Tax=Porphyromonas sp. COT-108 OH1349 TaxID=1537504 RepID=UPI000AD3438F|nr:FRG domain-containing protein [Porphyromonas sp. COT-108 OH1349]